MGNRVVADLRNEILAFYGLSPEHGFVDAGGIRTFFLSAGSGPPLVMLHGAGGGGVFWAPVIDRLRSHFRIIIPDVVGYGESAKPDAPYDRLFYARWLSGFLNAMGMKNISLVGNSQGGAIALQFAIDCPDRVDRLALVCSAGLMPLRCLGWAAIMDMIRAQFFVSKAAMLRLTRHLVYNPGRFPLDSAVRYLAAVAGMPGGRRAFSNGRGRAVRLFTQNERDRVQCPTLLVWGTEDRIIRPVPSSARKAAIPGARVVLMPEAGHTPFIDQPDLFSRYLTAFISGAAVRRCP